MTTIWSGREDDYWDAVAVCGDPESDEQEVIQATVLIQQVLLLAQDALTRPDSATTAPASVPPPALKLRPQPGDVVSIKEAAELFADRWILQPVDPDRISPISAHRDYRMRDGKLEYNSSYPPKWQQSGGEVTDVPQWRVMCQEASDSEPVAQPLVSGASPRMSRTTIRTGT